MRRASFSLLFLFQGDKMSDLRTFFKNTILTFSRQVLSILIGVVTVIIIARVLGPEGQGEYTLLTLFATLLFTFLNFGFNVSSTYYIGKGNIYDEHTIWKTNLIVMSFLSILSILAGGFVIIFLKDLFFSSISTSYLSIMLLILPFFFLLNFVQSIFLGYQNFDVINISAILTQLLILILTFLFLNVFHMNVLGAILAFIISNIIISILLVILLLKKYHLSIKKGVFSIPFAKDAFNYGIKVHISNLVSFFNYRADTFLIAYFSNPLSVGIYNVAVSIAERLWIVSQSVSNVLFPKISSMSNNDEKDYLTTMLTRNVLLISIITSIILVLISDFLILLLFGSAYEDAALPLKILMPGIVFLSVDRILSNDLSGRGKPEMSMYTSITTIILNIFLNIILIPKYGLSGAAFSTSLSYTVAFIIKIIIFKRLTGKKIVSILIINHEDILLYKKLYKRFLKVQRRERV